jgi:hypothetical protein
MRKGQIHRENPVIALSLIFRLRRIFRSDEKNNKK